MRSSSNPILRIGGSAPYNCRGNSADEDESSEFAMFRYTRGFDTVFKKCAKNKRKEPLEVKVHDMSRNFSDANVSWSGDCSPAEWIKFHPSSLLPYDRLKSIQVKEGRKARASKTQQPVGTVMVRKYMELLMREAREVSKVVDVGVNSPSCKYVNSCRRVQVFFTACKVSAIASSGPSPSR